MRRLAVLHHRFMDWLPALREAAPDLDIQGCRPEAWRGLDPAWLAGAEGLFCWKLPPGLVAAMPALAWVQNSGAGVDHLVAHPELPPTIPITRADGQFGFWMARYVCGHLLAEGLQVEACAQAQLEGAWRPKLLPEDLTGAQVVVVGFGRIGRQIGRALRELGCSVTGVVRTPRPDPEFPLAPATDLPRLLPEARALILAAPATPGTRHLVDGPLLSHGHPGLTLINVGRGELVDEVALLAALDAGHLGHAVLDVFATEPLPPQSPLWAHPKVTVTPHHSGPSTPRQLIPDILDNLERFARGEAVQGAVDRARGY